MNSNSNVYTIFPSSTSAFVTATSFKWCPKGNKRKNFREREKWKEEFRKSISETRLDPPSGNLWYMDFRA